MNILFVCTGNHNRSPAAQIIYKTLSPRDNVKSAATVNKDRVLTNRAMVDALRRKGYIYTKIYSRPVTKDLLSWADVVFYMQPSHLTELNKIYKHPYYVNLGHWINKPKIHDPHYEGSKSFDNTVRDIEKAIKNFLRSRK